ncbi:hypothetical protein SVI_1264 [Shewanella violacea DSS12]|uniref:Uncharacterized protein n=1 Tax=Shewanella violacea (strain JCM 10179 / CIP 106290 / LMG 19151 / DSS12) TaxID=637905 RepID=D4ZHT6_SHEVD|nr:hypothetical protein SVI_1264 [Shewanella violacea DSS12]
MYPVQAGDFLTFDKGFPKHHPSLSKLSMEIMPVIRQTFADAN